MKQFLLNILGLFVVSAGLGYSIDLFSKAAIESYNKQVDPRLNVTVFSKLEGAIRSQSNLHCVKCSASGVGPGYQTSYTYCSECVPKSQ